MPRSILRNRNSLDLLKCNSNLARPVDGVASLSADGRVAKLPRPTLLAVALQGAFAGAMEAAWQGGTLGAVVSLPADVTPIYSAVVNSF